MSEAIVESICLAAFGITAIWARTELIKAAEDFWVPGETEKGEDTIAFLDTTKAQAALAKARGEDDN